MPIKKAARIVILAQAAFVAVQLVMNGGSLWQSSEAIAAPEEPFRFFWALSV